MTTELLETATKAETWIEDYQEEDEETDEDDTRYELIEGEMIVMSGPNYLHTRLATRLAYLMETYLDPKGWGAVLNSGAFRLEPKTEVIPDVAFVVAARLEGIDPDQPLPFAPDLAIEVNSPSDQLGRIHRKVQLYQKFNTRLIWSIYPLENYILVYNTSDRVPKFLGPDDELDGADVIPGFKLAIKTLFE